MLKRDICPAQEGRQANWGREETSTNRFPDTGEKAPQVPEGGCSKQVPGSEAELQADSRNLVTLQKGPKRPWSVSGSGVEVPTGGVCSGLEILSKDNGGPRCKDGPQPGKFIQDTKQMQDPVGSPGKGWQDPTAGGNGGHIPPLP